VICPICSKRFFANGTELSECVRCTRDIIFIYGPSALRRTKFTAPLESLYIVCCKKAGPQYLSSLMCGSCGHTFGTDDSPELIIDARPYKELIEEAFAEEIRYLSD